MAFKYTTGLKALSKSHQLRLCLKIPQLLNIKGIKKPQFRIVVINTFINISYFSNTLHTFKYLHRQ